MVTAEQVAVKMERIDSKKQVLKLEVAVLKKLQGEIFWFSVLGRVLMSDSFRLSAYLSIHPLWAHK